MGKLKLYKRDDDDRLLFFDLEVESGQISPAEWLIHKIAPHTVLRPTFRDSPRIRIR